MSGLEALDAVRDGRRKKAKSPWVRAPFAPWSNPTVLAFDPSLTSTGWAVMTRCFPFVHEVGNIRTAPLDGEEGNLQRGVEIYRQASALMARLTYQWQVPLLVVHEMPPSGGSAMMRTDAIKTASLAVRIAAEVNGLDIHRPVSDLTVKKRLVGRSQRVAKADIKIALNELWPHLPAKGMRWNDDIRDAIGVGIITMEEHR